MCDCGGGEARHNREKTEAWGRRSVLVATRCLLLLFILAKAGGKAKEKKGKAKPEKTIEDSICATTATV